MSTSKFKKLRTVLGGGASNPSNSKKIKNKTFFIPTPAFRLFFFSDLAFNETWPILCHPPNNIRVNPLVWASATKKLLKD